ncbi:MAG: hypothetical protein ACFFDT_34920, partial [Candidatus Hodarchaeota archaeon]
MTIKSNWSPSFKILEPLSIIPALTYLDQFNIIGSNLNSLISNSEIIQWKKFLSTKSQLEEKKCYDLFNQVKISFEEVKYWKYDKYAFLFVHYDIDKLFGGKGTKLLCLIRDELDSNNLDWLFVNSSKRTFIFTLTSNHYLIWSPIIPGLEFIFQALIILNPRLLDPFTDLYRWKKLENGKKNISNVLKLWFEDPEVYEQYCKKSDSFHDFTSMQILMGIQKLILLELKRNVSKTVNSMVEINLENTLNCVLDPNILTMLQNFQTNGCKDFSKSNSENWLKLSFTRTLTQVNIVRILDIYPMNFLEIFPQFNPTSNYQKTGSFYTPIALAEILVKQSFEELIQTISSRTKNN